MSRLKWLDATLAEIDAITAEMTEYAEGCQKRGLRGVATRIRDWAERLENI